MKVCTMEFIFLQSGRSRALFPYEVIVFFSLPNPSSRNVSLGLNQPLTVPGIFLWVKGGLPARKADNLTASVNRLS
jgi:hypothetical protein